MVYTYTGASPSLAGFGISEIQNGEGRYVNGKLEYGYTDHVGNLRLSYKDSLGVAFITQSQSYDPWSNVNAGSEYQLSGIQGDRYLVSGKENDSITGNTLLDWRDYDSVTGRMNSFDPDGSDGGQISLSPFAYSWNNPVSLNDPNGRCPMCIGFMIGMFTSAISNMASGKMPSNIGQFLLPGVTGAIGGGVGAGMAGIFGQAGTFGGAVLRGAAGGAISGGISGGIGSMLGGGNFGNGFLDGAISGGVSGGLMGGIGHLSMQAKLNKAFSGRSPGSSDGGSMVYDAEQADLEMQFQHGSDYKQRLNIKNIKLGESWNKDFPKDNDPYLSDKGIFKKGAFAKTFGSQENGSTIYFGKKAFSNFTTFHNISTHEMIHAFHFSMGLYGGESVNHPMVGDFNRSEYGAYSLNAAQEMAGTTNTAHYYQNILNGYEGFGGAKYSWKRIYESLPTFQQTRRIP
jgi:RHS repeat-associated protein